MIYTVKDIEEPDFGCEGLMDGQQVIDKVTLIDEKGNLLYIEAADMYLYDKGIDVGDKVIIQDNLLVKARMRYWFMGNILHRKEEYYG